MTNKKFLLEKSATYNASPIVLFDGVCNFCNGTVNFLIRQDRNKKLKFAALQSEAGQQLLEQFHLPKKDFDSFVLVENGKAYTESSGALKLFGHLPWYWQWMKLGWILPRFLRDAVYSFISRNRYKWYGKKDQCMIPTPEVRSRFL